MMRRGTIRFRLTLWYAAVLSAGLGLFGVLIWVTLRSRLMAEVDQELAGRAAQFEAYFKSQSNGSAAHIKNELDEFCQALPAGSLVYLQGANGFSFRYAAGTLSKPDETRMLSRPFLFDGEQFDLQVSSSIAAANHALDLLRILLLGLLPVVIVIACVGGAWISARALKPVQDISDAAISISIDNLSDRLPVPPHDDELARLTNVLNTMLGRLESAVKTLSQFAADASHELRTPLAVIRTSAELALRRSRTPESYQESLKQIEVEAERMTQLVEDLLTLARRDAAFEMPQAPVDLSEVLKDVCVETRQLAELRRIRIRASINSEAAIVVGNRPALQRLFLALVDNAIKYSPNGGEVIVNLETSDTRTAVTVRDFGTGIPEDDLPHIFKRFYRADRARTGDGHGLGLALANSVAQAHNASIEVESRENEGTLFRVSFTAPNLKPELVSQL